MAPWTFEQLILAIFVLGIVLYFLWLEFVDRPQNQYRHYNNNYVARDNDNATNWIDRQRRERRITLHRNSNSPSAARQRIQGYAIPVFQRLNVLQTISNNPALGMFFIIFCASFRVDAKTTMSYFIEPSFIGTQE